MTVATAQAALYDKYTADLAALEAGSVQRLRAAEAIERWYALAQTQATREAAMISAYSLGGRAVTYASFDSGRDLVERLRNEVEGQLYASGSALLDCRGGAP